MPFELIKKLFKIASSSYYNLPLFTCTAHSPLSISLLLCKLPSLFTPFIYTSVSEHTFHQPTVGYSFGVLVFFPNLKNKEQNGKISKHAEVFKGQNHPLTSAVKLCDSKTIQIRNSKLCNFTKVVLKYVQFF